MGEIPVGFASVFMVILIGFFVLTVWFGKPEAPVVQRPSPKVPAANDSPSELNAG
jgi:hypothetical protein